MKIRAVCTDIDGTLLDSRRALSKRTIDAIRIISKDVPVILASSRMPAAMRHIQHELGIEDHPMICFNGGFVMSNGKLSHVLDSVTMPLSIGAAVIDLAMGSTIHVSLFIADKWYTALNDQWTERETLITKVGPTLIGYGEILENLKISNSGIHKIMCMGPEAEIEEMYLELKARFFHEIHVYRSKSTYLEIAPKEISKATALALVMKRIFNSDVSEVMAFGDNYNDVDMIRSAGYGVAVGNAIPEVKAVAREITLNGKDDGVAVAIEKYLF